MPTNCKGLNGVGEPGIGCYASIVITAVAPIFHKVVGWPKDIATMCNAVGEAVMEVYFCITIVVMALMRCYDAWFDRGRDFACPHGLGGCLACFDRGRDFACPHGLGGVLLRLTEVVTLLALTASGAVLLVWTEAVTSLAPWSRLSCNWVHAAVIGMDQ